jgi:hypothetical protein
MSETRYPAWWAKLQEDMVKAGCFEEGAPDRFSIVMTPEDELEWMDGCVKVIEITTEGGGLAALDAARKGVRSRLCGVPVFVTKHAIRGRPTLVPAWIMRSSDVSEAELRKMYP